MHTKGGNANCTTGGKGICISCAFCIFFYASICGARSLKAHWGPHKHLLKYTKHASRNRTSLLVRSWFFLHLPPAHWRFETWFSFRLLCCSMALYALFRCWNLRNDDSAYLFFSCQFLAEVSLGNECAWRWLCACGHSNLMMRWIDLLRSSSFKDKSKTGGNSVVCEERLSRISGGIRMDT